MPDIFETTIICEKCNKKTTKKAEEHQGFRMRSWECPSCRQIWHHPQDEQDFQQFKKLKDKQFQVKLRLVGNSYTVSIPREIIEFEEDMKREMAKMDKMMRICLEEPHKLGLFFEQRRRFL
jgi:ssDNA-binding Zn-finger/Zn-ribbon topoisomerase 1